MSEPKYQISQTEAIAAFAEWRGTINAALDYIKEQVNRLRDEDLEQWEIIEQIRGTLEKNRDRCDQMAGGKTNSVDFDELKKDVAGNFRDLKKEVSTQGKTQVRQGVTMVFYGLIGGALFSFLTAMFNKLIQ